MSRIRRKSFGIALAAFTSIIVFAAGAVCAATVWDGPPVAFEKAAFSDGSLPANQDPLTDDVVFARLGSAGLFNAAAESFYNRVSNESPAGTLWAFSGLNGNPLGSEFGAAQFAALTFDTWVAALGGPPALASNILNRPAVVHLLDKDIYLDLTFTGWGVRPQSGAGFAYSRSTAPVPLPAGLPLLLAGLFAMSVRRRRWLA